MNASAVFLLFGAFVAFCGLTWPKDDRPDVAVLVGILFVLVAIYMRLGER